MEGCSPAIAAQAIDHSASLHAATWNGTLLGDAPWIKTLAGQYEELFAQQRQHTHEFIQRLGNRLEPDILDLAERISTG